MSLGIGYISSLAYIDSMAETHLYLVSGPVSIIQERAADCSLLPATRTVVER